MFPSINTSLRNFSSSLQSPPPIPANFSVKDWGFEHVQLAYSTGAQQHSVTWDASTQYLGIRLNSWIPPGAITQYAGATAPAGYLFCDGSAVSRLQYHELFAAIGTQYGAGDSVTTFNIPDLQSYVPVGRSAAVSAFGILGQTGGEVSHTLTVDELPAHNHAGTTDASGLHAHNYQDAYFAENRGGGPNNVFGTNAATDTDNSFKYRTAAGSYSDSPSDIPTSSSGTHTHTFTTNNTGNGQAHNVLQPYIVLNYIIKC
jgi:microcystin-dependent protein